MTSDYELGGQRPRFEILAGEHYEHYEEILTCEQDTHEQHLNLVENDSGASDAQADRINEKVVEVSANGSVVA